MRLLFVVDLIAAAVCLSMLFEILRRRPASATKGLIGLLASGASLVLLALAVVKTSPDRSVAFSGFMFASAGTSLIVASQFGLGAALGFARPGLWPKRIAIAVGVLLLAGTPGKLISSSAWLNNPGGSRFG